MNLEVYKFNAHFTAGLMKGMISEQTMTFVGESEALDFVYRVNVNNRKGECPYWISDLEFVETKSVEKYYASY